jgi:DNA mismatch repair protein MutS2
MEQRTLGNLEFSKILSIISSFAGSRAGKDKIMNLEVSKDANFIQERLAETEEYISCTDLGFRLNPSGLRDLREIISLLEAGSTVLGGEDFLTVRANLALASELKKELNSQDKEIFKKYRRIFEPVSSIVVLSNLAERINECFDEVGQIKTNASPTLASIRRDYTQSVAKLEKELNAFIHSKTDLVQDRYFTIRNDRYVVPINASSQNQIQGIIHDQSATGQTVFIEPLQFLPANNRLAQLRLSEAEEIKRILMALTGMVYQHLGALKEQFEILVWLDVLRAKSIFAKRYQCSFPQVSRDGELRLQNARHPLLHPNCVPLDISLHKEQRCIVITGPNGGGKTVSMKTVGLNSLLMQTGNFVLAAEGARLPIFTEILSDIGESQSIEHSLSTFTAHLQRLREIEALADSKSLILIDEICVGTDPLEGGALAAGFLKEICGRGAYAIVTSHYDSLKNLAFTTKGFINAAMEFNYETFRPTFRFILGLPGKSNALAMARAFNLPESILKDLVEVNAGVAQKEKGLLEAIERERNRAENLRQAYVKRITALRSKEQEMEETWEKLQEFRKTKRDKLTEEFTAEMRRKLKEVEGVISRLKGVISKETAAKKAQELAAPLEEARSTHGLLKDSIKNLETAPVEKPKASQVEMASFKVGSKVSLQDGNRTGVIRRLLGQSKAEVDFDGISFTVALEELSLASLKGGGSASKKASSKKSGSKEAETGRVYAPRPFVRSDLDIRGLRAEEGVNEVENYLRVAADSGLGQVFIIHGVGTGALQKAVTDFLRASPWRKKFRSGRYGEGGMGVTVVELTIDN